MRVVNPDYQPVAGPLAAIQAEIAAWFAANTGTESISFDQLRNYFSNNGYPGAVNWSDGAIHQQLIDWGYTVETD